MNRLRPLLAAAQMVLLLAMQLAEGTGVHHCPEHDAGVGAATPSGMVAHPGHQAGMPQQEHGLCHCVGVCCQANLVYAAPAPVGAIPAIAPAPLPLSRIVTTLRDNVRLLPFAIGPPPPA